MNNDFKYIYGPVSSWRLGSSLGIDPISGENKICGFDCIYCQIKEPSLLSLKREIFVNTELIADELQSLPSGLNIDCITLSGRGEPTLALNIKDITSAAKSILGHPVALLTNSTMLLREDVRDDISDIDFVIAKIDASSNEYLRAINKPHEDLDFLSILDGIKRFRVNYKGKFGIQIMFLKSNESEAKGIARLVSELAPDEVQLNTPLRDSAVKALSKEEMGRITEFFKDFNVISVYDREKKIVESISEEDTMRRRGKNHDS
ncbi:MAG: radical SAM protein [Candidatus Kaelpia aquatica]|nr:radical SAM protein [Candidatus Kaelpia aquatica]